VNKLASIGRLDDGIDTSVPGIEPSDLNDGEILSRTRENVNPNGQFQFIYIPEDGSENIVSDWISQEHKKKVTLSWVEGVKAAIIGRAQAGLREANEKAAEERLKRIQKEQMEDDGDDAAIPELVAENRPPVAAKSRRTETMGRAASTTASDPVTYVKDQLDAARERLKAAEDAQKDIIREVLSARRDYDKWKTLARALAGDGGDSSVDSELPVVALDAQTTSVRAVSDDVQSVSTMRTERKVLIPSGGHRTPSKLVTAG
jgi:hypothetical protein